MFLKNYFNNLTPKRIVKACVFSFLVGASIGAIITKLSPRMVVIKGESMEPTLKDGDRYYVKDVNSKETVNRFDIVTYEKEDGTSVCKRVIGIPGDTIGKPFVENEIVLKNNEYFLVGDNLEVSYDSRYYGPVRLENITSKLVKKTF